MTGLSPSRAVAGALEAIVPDGVAVRVWEGDDIPELMDEEEAAVARAVAGRRIEFARGRACVRAAITALGGPTVAIPVGESREPVWPRGFVGSITHTSGLVAALAARSQRVASVGLDAEPARPLPAEVRRLVLSPSEARPEQPEMETVIFSAKESIYKALFPLTRRWLDFLEVEVSLEPSTGRFTARGLPVRDRDALALLDGRFMVAGGYVLTLSYMAAPTETSA